MEEWYDMHPEASYGEIEAEAREGRRELMGKGSGIWMNGGDNGGYRVSGGEWQKMRR